MMTVFTMQVVLARGFFDDTKVLLYAFHPFNCFRDLGCFNIFLLHVTEVLFHRVLC